MTSVPRNGGFMSSPYFESFSRISAEVLYSFPAISGILCRSCRIFWISGRIFPILISNSLVVIILESSCQFVDVFCSSLSGASVPCSCAEIMRTGDVSAQVQTMRHGVDFSRLQSRLAFGGIVRSSAHGCLLSWGIVQTCRIPPAIYVPERFFQMKNKPDFRLTPNKSSSLSRTAHHPPEGGIGWRGTFFKIRSGYR